MNNSLQVETGFAEVNGTRLYYEIAGAGHPLVLVHGGLVDRRLWDGQFEAFAQHYRVVRYDQRGFGNSALVTEDTPPYTLHEDLYHLLRFLNIDKAYVMGLSMGGGVSIDFTLAYPQVVEALIPVASGLSGFTPANVDELRAMWGRFSAALQAGDVPQAVEITLRYFTDGPKRRPEQVDARARERVRDMGLYNYARPNAPSWSLPAMLEPPAVGRLSEISAPTLVVVGDQDAAEIQAIADLLATQIRGARKVVIPDTAHHLPLEKPDEFNRAVLEFLDALSTSR